LNKTNQNRFNIREKGKKESNDDKTEDKRDGKGVQEKNVEKIK
jgi:hypothetical protein